MIDYLTTVGTLTGIFAIAAAGLNITLGYAGVFSAAQAVFVGIGAYVTALLGPAVNGSFLICALVGIGISVVAAIVLASTGLRVSDEYFIVASLALQIIISTVFTSWYSLTKGTDGISGVPYPRVLGAELPTRGLQTGLVWVVAIIVVLVTAVLRRGAVGRLFFAIREDPVATQTMGRSPVVGKYAAIVLGAAVSSVGGVLYAFYTGFVNSPTFGYSLSIELVAIVVVGGIGWSAGPVLGSAIIVAAIPLISLLNLPSTAVGPLQQLVYGALIIGVVLLRGYFPAIRAWRKAAV
ncbi:branched-chain amino acid ABC transporter permease [Amycolatopsis jejuensis]|uniref:branched-chain amino acid ABC transporter permease n=1 Tax=Amycolatopsis jejuensis TaxID=330084 RepID=UPI0005251EBA|nr:branched-chain amino acid ABC transporter permease [Amycolatopsis jejuensis]